MKPILLILTLLLTSFSLQAQVNSLPNEKVSFHLEVSDELEIRIQKLLTDLPYCFISEANPDYLIKEYALEDSSREVMIFLDQEAKNPFSNFEPVSITDLNFGSKIITMFEETIKIKVLKNLESDSRDIDFNVLIYFNDEKISNANFFEIPENAELVIAVKNTGDIPFYISWINFLPSQQLYAESNPQYSYLPVGPSLTLSKMKMSDLGSYLFKFIASEDFINTGAMLCSGTCNQGLSSLNGSYSTLSLFSLLTGQDINKERTRDVKMKIRELTVKVN